MFLKDAHREKPNMISIYFLDKNKQRELIFLIIAFTFYIPLALLLGQRIILGKDQEKFPYMNVIFASD